MNNIKENIVINGNTYSLPFIVLPKDTVLYRGVDKTCEYTDDKFEVKKRFLFLTTDIDTAEEYASKQDYYKGCIISYKLSRDLKLLDLWTKDTFDMLYKEIKDEFDLYEINTFSGVRFDFTDNFINEKEVRDNYPKFFADGQFKDNTFLYKGLEWGSSEGQFKRSSTYQTDPLAFDILFKLIPNLDGFFCFEVPTYRRGYTRIKKFVFHSEIIINKPFIAEDKKIELVSKEIQPAKSKISISPVPGGSVKKRKTRRLFRNLKNHNTSSNHSNRNKIVKV